MQCHKCGNPKVKWKCKTCVVLVCNNCKDSGHSNKGHHIINLTYHERNIIDVKECESQLKLIRFLAVSYDNLLWIGNGCHVKHKEHPTALQCTTVRDRLNIISSFNMIVKEIAVTPDNEILLATDESRLQQIRTGVNERGTKDTRGTVKLID
ncbi:unnamed protein product [Mytilus coruscus]|uniref:B box-type domain-containing protein n=1 Tax=Mytilus coruscus TaxID=42192 RepID=A0A6J8DKX2_MYTCO|nr:unnamed protein product [Mytilus coruscus]